MTRGGGRPTTALLTPPTAPVNPGEIADIRLLCRGVNRTSVSPTANTELAFLVQQALTNNPVFKQATLEGELKVDDGNTNTFTFSLMVKLAHPFKL